MLDHMDTYTFHDILVSCFTSKIDTDADHTDADSRSLAVFETSLHWVMLTRAFESLKHLYACWETLGFLCYMIEEAS